MTVFRLGAAAAPAAAGDVDEPANYVCDAGMPGNQRRDVSFLSS
jgi:hypothetical protein